MARKNKNAGQPNREAQQKRHSVRVAVNTNFKRSRVAPVQDEVTANEVSE